MHSAIQWSISFSLCNWSNVPWPPPHSVYGAEEISPGAERSVGVPAIRWFHLEPLPPGQFKGLEIDLILYRYARCAW